jgi:hypothetical protein
MTTPTDSTPTPNNKKKRQKKAGPRGFSTDRLKGSHSAQLDRAVQIIPALRALKSKEGSALADAMVAKMEEAGKETLAAHTFLTDKATLRDRVTLTADALRKSVEGVYGLTATEPAMAAKLPVRTDYAALDKETLARKMAQELTSCGKRGALLGELLAASADAALEATQKLETFVDSDAPVRNGQAAVTELHMMNLQAVALIRRSTKSGSPAWNMIKHKRKAKAPKDATPAAPDATPPAAHPAPATAPTNGAVVATQPTAHA